LFSLIAEPEEFDQRQQFSIVWAGAQKRTSNTRLILPIPPNLVSVDKHFFVSPPPLHLLSLTFLLIRITARLSLKAALKFFEA
jgi:hypothetical protein